MKAKNLRHLLPSFQQHQRLKASTLLYTLSICMLVGLLLSSMVMLSGYTRLQNDSIYFRELAQDNLESGKNLILYGGGEVFGDFSSNLYDSPIDSYVVKSEAWGLYGLMHVTGVHGPARARQSFLFGARPEGIFATSLFLEDRNRPLILAGATQLQGNLMLPEAGLKGGFVGRQGFTGKHLHDGPVSSSAGSLMRAHYTGVEVIASYMERLRSGGSFSSLPFHGDSLYAAWGDQPMVLAASGEVRLDDNALVGKIIVVAPKVTIGRAARLADVIICANAVHVDSGFTGRLQIFANDSIIVEPHCAFGYPSVLMLGGASGEFGRLILGRKSEIHGLVLSDPNFGVGRALEGDSYTLIDAEATVVGNLVVFENLDLKGNVIGNVTTGKFRLLTPGAVYDNHLMNAKIGSDGLHPSFAMPLIQEKPNRFVEILQLGRVGI